MAINKLSLGLAVACSTLAVGANFTAPAQATSLATGTVNITGTSNFVNTSFLAPATDTVTLSNATVLGSSTGAFTSYIGQAVNLTSINLTELLSASGNGVTTKQVAEYKASASNPFITFSDGLQFIIDNPFDFTREATTRRGVQVLSGSALFTGTFVNAAGKTVGVGDVTLQEIRNNGSFSMSIDAQSVPEPGTVFGLTTVFAAGYLSRKKLARKLVTEKTHA